MNKNMHEIILLFLKLIYYFVTFKSSS